MKQFFRSAGISNKLLRTMQVVILFLMSSLLSLNALSQDETVLNEPVIIPPSPTAYELGKYGQIPVGLFTGTPNYNLPLYEYKTKNLSVPISLSYNSNGIKVDQVESNIGLGWSLNAGGVISKIVRGKEDEGTDKYIFPEEEIDAHGVYDPMAAEFFYEAGMGIKDTEIDLFMFNFPGGSGKFMYDNDKKIVLIPHQDIKIEGYVNGTQKGYKITTTDGVQYIFTEIEQSVSRISGAGHTEPEFTKASAWYLSRIIHPFGDAIDFTYVAQNYQYIATQSQTLTLANPPGQRPSGYAYPDIVKSLILDHNIRIIGKRLINITSNNSVDGDVSFSYNQGHPTISGYNLVSKITINDQNSSEMESFDFDYIVTANNRLFLSKVQYKDPDNTYELDYIDPQGFPERLSFSQDHWVFFNNEDNEELIPKLDFGLFEHLNFGANKEPNSNYAKKGMLAKITYPTKGSTQMIYEGNSYFGEKTIPAQYGELSLTTSSAQIPNPGGTTENIEVGFSQQIKIIVNVWFNRDDAFCVDAEAGWPSDHTKATLNITNNETNERIDFYIINEIGQVFPRDNSFAESESSVQCYADLLDEGSYTIQLKPDFMCVNATAKIIYVDVPETTTEATIETGGLRIQKTIDYDPVKQKQVIKHYYYGSIDNLTRSSGDPGQNPVYIDYLTIRTGDDPYGVDDFVDIMVLKSNSMNSLFNTGNSNIYYQYVTISHGDSNFKNGGEEHEYIIHRDTYGGHIHGQGTLVDAPLDNTGWNNGLEKGIKYFKKNDLGEKTILKEITNHYVTDGRNYDEVKAYRIRKNYELVMTGDIVYNCTSDDVNKKYIQHYCAADHKHIWYLDPISGETVCIAPGANWQTREICHHCYGKPVGHQIVYANNLKNLDIVGYTNHSYWHYLNNIVTKQYDQNGLNPVTTTTNYYYDNADHIQLTQSETIAPNGDEILSKMYYPHDLGITSLIDQHRFGELVKSEKYFNGDKTTTKLKANYTDWGNGVILPERIETSKGDNTPEPRLRYYDYDDMGNPLELSKEDDKHIAYYWGYDGKYPIIKAENINYADLSSAVNTANGDIESLLTNIGDMTTNTQKANWKTFITSLKNNPLLSDAFIITYTYKPLVGITSQTDPNGVSTYYEYDEFNRLKTIRDNDNNIIKRYNYKSESNISGEISNLVVMDVQDDLVELGWDDVSGAKSYLVYRSDNDDNFVKLGETTISSYTDDAVEADKYYSYKVQFIQDIFISPFSEELQVKTLLPKPDVPTNVTATTLSNKNVRLRWDDGNYETGYRIWKSTTNSVGSYTIAADNLPKNSTSYDLDVDGLEAGTLYYFKVEAYNTSYSTESAVIEKYTTPERPTMNTPVTISNTQINLSWTDVKGEVKYVLGIDKNNSNIWTYNDIGANVTIYQATGLESDTPYRFNLTAVNSDGDESNASYSVSVQTYLDPPGTPSLQNLSCPAGGQVTLNWTNVTGEGGYHIYQKLSTVSAWTYAKSVAVNSTSSTVINLGSGHNYDFKVRAYNRDYYSESNVKTILTLPGTPSAFTGATTVCSGNEHPYSFAASVTGATTYEWSVPSGSTITWSSQDKKSIKVQFGTSSGTIKVRAVNSTGYGSYRYKSITVLTAIPSKPGGITGATKVDTGVNYTYSISPVTGATSYEWIHPATNQVCHTGPETSITIYFTSSFSMGSIKVKAINCKGSSSFSTKTILTD